MLPTKAMFALPLCKWVRCHKKPPKKLQNKQPNSLTLSMQSFALFVTTTSSLQTHAMRRRQWWHSVAMMLLSTPPLPTTKGKKTKTRANNPTHCHCKHNHLHCLWQPHHQCKCTQCDDGCNDGNNDNSAMTTLLSTPPPTTIKGGCHQWQKTMSTKTTTLFNTHFNAIDNNNDIANHASLFECGKKRRQGKKQTTSPSNCWWSSSIQNKEKNAWENEKKKQTKAAHKFTLTECCRRAADDARDTTTGAATAIANDNNNLPGLQSCPVPPPSAPLKIPLLHPPWACHHQKTLLMSCIRFNCWHSMQNLL